MLFKFIHLRIYITSLDDVASSQPTIRANCASMVIDDVIHSTPEYQPRQICKDFVRQMGCD